LLVCRVAHRPDTKYCFCEVLNPSLGSWKRQCAFCKRVQQLSMNGFPTKSLEPEEFNDKSLLPFIYSRPLTDSRKPPELWSTFFDE
jgi:hypothetical protein